MKLTLVVRAGLGLGRGKIAAQAAHAAVVSALANLGTPDFRAWLRDGSLPSRPGPHLALGSSRRTPDPLTAGLFRNAHHPGS
jgi:Peptidyl-tRNA hydrolase PTH2